MDELPPIELSELKQKIITDEIQEYHNLKDLQLLISRLKSESDQSIDEFKDVIIMLTEELSRVTGDHMLTMHKSDIIGFVNKNAKGLIDSFILKCYEAKDGLMRGKIVKGDDSFFLSNSLDDVSDGDSEIVNIIFKFKNFWGKLNTENREIIKNSLMALISLSDVRYLSFKKYQCLKKLNPSSVKLFSDFDKLF